MASSFEFSAGRPRLWTGRYARIPGEKTAFHVRLLDGAWWPFVDWAVDDEVGHCPMVDGEGAERLTAAVSDAKRFLGGWLGGAFLINEFGQVLVPAAAGDRRVAIVGECDGPLQFQDVLHGDGTFDLSDDQGLNPGDPWRLPYLGVPHNLSGRGEIYFKLQDEFGMTPLPAPTQDDELIDALRSLRPYGPVRLLVTYGGLVLTKVPVGPRSAQRWEPRYVGELDYDCWYPKEKS
jgi:hypothetical protein